MTSALWENLIRPHPHPRHPRPRHSWGRKRPRMTPLPPFLRPCFRFDRRRRWFRRLKWGLRMRRRRKSIRRRRIVVLRRRLLRRGRAITVDISRPRRTNTLAPLRNLVGGADAGKTVGDVKFFLVVTKRGLANFNQGNESGIGRINQRGEAALGNDRGGAWGRDSVAGFLRGWIVPVGDAIPDRRERLRRLRMTGGWGGD